MTIGGIVMMVITMGGYLGLFSYLVFLVAKSEK